jgi:N-acetylmuramic acid 6-phosphate etherase
LTDSVLDTAAVRQRRSEPPELDQLPTGQVIGLLLDGEARVLPALRRAAPQLEAAAAAVAGVIAGGGRLVLAGSGTSGRLAAAEAAELPGTFGLDPARCCAVVSGADSPAIDDTAEDDATAGAAGVAALGVGRGDVLIAVAASGRTPFTLAAARAARAAGTTVVAVVNAPGSPLATLASVAVEVLVGDEVLRGSTRLTAGTAQKVALNTLTTAGMARAGRVHGDLMIDVVAANAKLRARAVSIVAEITGCSMSVAAVALAACDDDARAAVLHVRHGLTPAEARIVAAAHPSLRAALDR